jgi:two-component system, LuxR family, sensor kinase FixL
MTKSLSSAWNPNAAAWALGVVVLYVLLDWSVRAYAAESFSVIPWNPSLGIGIAFLLARGLAWAPAIFAAAFSAELLDSSKELSVWRYVALALVITASQASVVAILRLRIVAFDTRLARIKDMIAFAIGTAGVTFIAAALNVWVQSRRTALGSTDIGWVEVYIEGAKVAERYALAATEFGPRLLGTWIADVIGALVVTPLALLIWHRRIGSPKITPEFMPHLFGIFLATMFAFWAVYGISPAEQITSLYLMFMPLSWAALKFGVPGAALTSLVIQVGLGFISFLGAQSETTMLQFQIRLFAIAGTGLLLGAAVDELRAAEQRLRERQSELDRTLRLAASAEMASAMAHELNQPLSAIGIYTRTCEMLLRDQPVPSLQTTMAKIGTEVRRAGEVVHKLREFYRSGSSHLERVSVEQLLTGAREAIRERAQRHRVEVVLTIAQGLPDVSIDPVQVGTVLHNLLTNAVEAIRDANSRERRIVLSARRGNQGLVEIGVRDTGPGIALDDTGDLFRPFSSNKSYGLGLGLSMSRSIVTANGGKLELIPSPVGCDFRFTLPTSSDLLHEVS